ncbi:MAG: 50S ribosomal protein L25 [Desulfovibrionaceae bacterium]
MAKDIQKLTVTERTATGKGPNRRLRVQSIVPGVYYDQKGTNILVQVPEMPLLKLYKKVGGNQVFNLELTRGGKTELLPSLVWRMKHDPVRPVLTHVDFFGVDLDKEIKVNVAIEVTGTAKGLKLGGVLAVFRDSVEVICKPLDIPEHILVDVTDLDVNDHVMVQDLAVAEGVSLVFEDNYAILGVVPKSDEEEGEEGEAEAEAETEGE